MNSLEQQVGEHHVNVETPDTAATEHEPAAFSNPLGGQIGNRNNLRGPGYWAVDLRLKKDIKMRGRTAKVAVLRRSVQRL